MTRSSILNRSHAVCVAFFLVTLVVGARTAFGGYETLFTAQCENGNDRFGTASEAAGDVNGDGYADIVAGAPNSNVGGTYAGRAYVYFGGVKPDSIADIVIPGEAAGDHFGCAVSGCGDLNGDGFDDFIVGASGSTAGGASGRAYVYFGGPLVDGVADLILTGPSGAYLGRVVAGVGDVNGDGWRDIAVNAAVGVGAYIYYGGPAIDSVPDAVLIQETAAITSLAAAGDVNSDGYSDVIAGSIMDTSGAGSASVFYMGPGADGIADLRLAGGADERFGYSVAGVGDVNGDGHHDILVGCYRGKHAAYVFFGGPQVDPIADVTLVPGGSFVSPVGDVNHDGSADLLAGGELDYIAYVYFGGPEIDGLPDMGLADVVVKVAAAGDVNGDGYVDIVVQRTGSISVVSTRPPESCPLPTLAAKTRTIMAPSDGGQLNPYAWAAYAAAGGDLNAGGRGDLAVDAGDRVLVYYGEAGAKETPDRILTVPSPYGTGSVSGPGDLNGDGYDDLVVGSPRWQYPSPNEGRVHVYFGGPALRDVPSLSIASSATDYAFGGRVVPAGDVNGDGQGDLIVTAAPSHTIGLPTSVFVYFGGPGFDSVPELVFRSADSYEGYGWSASSAGDLNGDGFDDIAVSAPYWSSGVPWEHPGRVYVYYGGSSPDLVPDLTLTSPETGYGFGNEMTGGGDYNGDGYDDFIVSGTGPLGGAAYVFLGGPNCDAQADIVLNGDVSQGFLGPEFAMVGDVDGNGAADVLASSTLGAYLFLGGRDADGTADVFLAAEGWDASLGISSWTIHIAGAKDIDGDGRADMILVAPWVAVCGGTGRVYAIGLAGREIAATLDLDPNTINLKSRAPSVTAYIELPGHAPESIDLSTVRLAGIVPPMPKVGLIGDHDSDRVPDLALKFARGALDSLLTLGVNRLQVTGLLVTGERFSGYDEVRVIDPPGGPLSASVSPNPLNPTAVLSFHTRLSGPVTVRIFDLQGRLVRTLLDRDVKTAGDHEARIDGRDGQGRMLSTGIYFYRIDSSGDVVTGRFTILK